MLTIPQKILINLIFALLRQPLYPEAVTVFNISSEEQQFVEGPQNPKGPVDSQLVLPILLLPLILKDPSCPLYPQQRIITAKDPQCPQGLLPSSIEENLPDPSPIMTEGGLQFLTFQLIIP